MSTSAWLVAISLVSGERRFLRVGPTPRLVGRGSSQDGPDKLRVDFDPNLSRRHFTVYADAQGLQVRREANQHPLFFEGEERSELVLKPGEHFSTGQTRFEHAIEGASIQAEPTISAMTMSTVQRTHALERDSHRCLNVLLEMQPLLGAASDPEALFGHLVPLVARVVPNAGMVMIIAVGDGSSFETIAAHGDSPPPRPTRTLLRSALESGEPVFHIFSDLRSNGLSAAAHGSPTLTAGVGWVLAAPIVPREGPAYVLYTVGTDDAGLLASDERLPGELDRAVLSLVARVVTQYLEGRHAVHLQAQIEAERRQRALAETLRDLANELTSALQLGDVLQRLLDFLHRAVPCERVVGLLRQGEALEVAAARGEVMALGQLTLPAEAPFLSRLAAVGSSVVVDEAVVLGAPRAEAGGEASRPVLCVPVLWSHAESPGGHELRGLLVLGRAQGRGFSAAEADTASLLASQAAIAFRNAALFEEVQRLATTDALTGACNRRHFLQRASRGLHRVLTDKQPVSVLMLDIDHFKSFNDTHGHAVGDQVLRHVAGHCQGVLREVDVFGRLGGEEFAVFLEASAEVAQGVAERIRQAVQTPLVTEGKTLSVTVSVGVAVAARDLLAALPEPDRALAETLRRADEALYAAKQQGRNRVCLAPAG